MAYTNSPEDQTYKTVSIQVDGRPMFRSGNLATQRDLQIVNMYYDRISQENKERNVRLVKRDGLSASSYSLQKSSPSAKLRGNFYDGETNTFYWSVDDKVYSYTPPTGVGPSPIRTVQTLTTSTGYVGFCSYLKADGTRLIIFTDGTKLYVYNYTTLTSTEVTSPNLPTPHQPYPLYLNGYLFLIKSNTSDIYNSEVDDPLVWASSDFVPAEIVADYSVRLFKVKNYLVVLGTGSVEYFWDAGNTTNSPLSRNDSPVKNVGYITGGVQQGDTVFFVGQDERQNISVYSINSFKVDKISNSIVERTLQTFVNTENSKSNVVLNTDGYIVSSNGHTFYVLVAGQTTWAYDIEERIWYEWRGSNGTGLKIEGVWSMFNGGCYMAIEGQSNISIMSPQIYQDFGVNFTCRYTTENTTFGTKNWKVCHRAAVHGSMHQNTGTSFVNLSWSDNDWADGGSTPRQINLFSNSPYITRCGKFRNRSWRLEYTDNYPWFVEQLEFDLNIYGI